MFIGSRRNILWYPFRAYEVSNRRECLVLCQVLCRSLDDMYTRKLSADVLFQWSVSALKPDTARRVESMTEIILLRSRLLHLRRFYGIEKRL